MINFAMQDVREIKKWERRALRRWSRFGSEVRLYVYVVSHYSRDGGPQLVGVNTSAWKSFGKAAEWTGNPQLRSVCAWQWRGYQWIYIAPGERGECWTVEREELARFSLGRLAMALPLVVGFATIILR